MSNIRMSARLRTIAALGTIAIGLSLVYPAAAQANTASQVAALAVDNAGKGAGTCSIVNPSPNSLGGTSFGSSCTGYNGSPEYWCADFVKWVWQNSGLNVNGLNAAAASFVTSGAGTVHSDSSYRPQVGDAVVYDYSAGWASHVGMVTAVNSDGSIQTINGDFGGVNGVSEPYFAETSKVTLNNIPASQVPIGSYVSSLSKKLTEYVTPSGLTVSTVYHRLRHPDGSWTADGTLTLSPVSAVADAADGSGINNVVALKNGQVYHQQRLANTSWTGWGPVGTPGTGVATDIAASTDSAGNLQVAVIVNGQIWHVIRNASNGMWGTWGNLGSAPGGAVTSIAASIDNSHGLLNLVAIAGGQIYHIQRNNTTGNWGGWGTVGAPGSTAPLDITAATDSGGNLQVAAVTADGTIWHQIRLAFNGGWTGWQQIGNPAGTTITAATAAIDTTQNILQLAVIANGQVYHRVRNTDSSWGPWGLAGNPGTAVALAATIDPSGDFQLVTAH